MSEVSVVEAMKLGYADRDAYYGDPDFVKVLDFGVARRLPAGLNDAQNRTTTVSTPNGTTSRAIVMADLAHVLHELRRDLRFFEEAREA